MHFNDILNSHLSKYLKSGSVISGRLYFLIMLFKDLKENNLDLDNAKKDVFQILKINFFNEMLTMLYEVILLKDIEKAISIVSEIEQVKKDPPAVTEKIQVKSQEDIFPDDIPDIDREAFDKRQADWDLEFLKSVGWKE